MVAFIVNPSQAVSRSLLPPFSGTEFLDRSGAGFLQANQQCQTTKGNPNLNPGKNSSCLTVNIDKKTE